MAHPFHVLGSRLARLLLQRPRDACGEVLADTTLQVLSGIEPLGLLHRGAR